ncbi:hypothetical protein Dip518_000811 [Parelusimicrobium proximum]|uniref:hypothetical protein n=1 Tax=Parelusimicrobium proximum TaxID=3228953 RepID=UPI003D17AF29
MMAKKEKPISAKQKMFVRAIVCKGMKQGEAYKKVFGDVKFPDSRASYLLKKASILKYYNEVSEKLENKTVEKCLWTKEVATYNLCWVLDKAKNEIEESGALTKPTVLGIVNCIKELNRMYGFDKAQNINNFPQVIFEGSDSIQD